MNLRIVLSEIDSDFRADAVGRNLRGTYMIRRHL